MSHGLLVSLPFLSNSIYAQKELSQRINKITYHKLYRGIIIAKAIQSCLITYIHFKHIHTFLYLRFFLKYYCKKGILGRWTFNFIHSIKLNKTTARVLPVTISTVFVSVNFGTLMEAYKSNLVYSAYIVISLFSYSN